MCASVGEVKLSPASECCSRPFLRLGCPRGVRRGGVRPLCRCHQGEDRSSPSRGAQEGSPGLCMAGVPLPRALLLCAEGGGDGRGGPQRLQPFGTAPSTLQGLSHPSPQKVPILVLSSCRQGQRNHRLRPRGQQGTHGCHPQLAPCCPAPSVRPTSPSSDRLQPRAARGTLRVHPPLLCWGPGDQKGQKRGWGDPCQPPGEAVPAPRVTVPASSLPRVTLAGKGARSRAGALRPPCTRQEPPGGSPSCSAPQGRRQGARCGADPRPQLLRFPGDRGGDPGWPRGHRCKAPAPSGPRLRSTRPRSVLRGPLPR